MRGRMGLGTTTHRMTMMMAMRTERRREGTAAAGDAGGEETDAPPADEGRTKSWRDREGR